MAVLSVLREGLDPLTIQLPLPSTLPFLYGTHAGRQTPFKTPFTALLTPPFPRPNYKRVEMIFFVPAAIGD
jgi:hypothetical protein